MYAINVDFINFFNNFFFVEIHYTHCHFIMSTCTHTQVALTRYINLCQSTNISLLLTQKITLLITNHPPELTLNMPKMNEKLKIE